MPTSAPGSSRNGSDRRGGARRSRGFTLIELLIVVAIVALASAVATLALRDPQASALEREAAPLFNLARQLRKPSALPYER